MSTQPSDKRPDFAGIRGEDALDIARLPQHVAIIMDGNGRWAKKQGKPRLFGHKAGAKAIRETLLEAQALGIKYLTVYGFSSENWSRPIAEVTGLMKLFVETLLRELDGLNENNVRLTVMGDLSQLPQATHDAFLKGIASTAHNTGLTFNVAINYGSRQDIVKAVRSLAAESAQGVLDPDDINEALIGQHLSSAGLPDPDLVIRTSGERRLSNFLLWECAYAEFYVTQTLWPDFDREELVKALLDYQNRKRRFGGLEDE